MMSISQKCFLRCLSQSHPDILLPDNIRLVLGRGPLTNIRDSRCSREQIALVPDYQTQTVKVEHCGANSTNVIHKNHKISLSQNPIVYLQHLDVINVLS